jgi:hypothetical protein
VFLAPFQFVALVGGGQRERHGPRIVPCVTG